MIDDSSLEGIKNTINLTNLSEINYYLMQKYGWSDVSDVIQQYKNYLFLLAKYKKLIPPSYEIEQVWRAHILLQPDKYLELSKKIFGDHYNNFLYRPFFKNNRFISKKDKLNFLNITMILFLEEFNQKIYDFNHGWTWFRFRTTLEIIFESKNINAIFTFAIVSVVVLYTLYIFHYNYALGNVTDKLKVEIMNLPRHFEFRQRTICRLTEQDEKNLYPEVLVALDKQHENDFNTLKSTLGYAYQNNLVTKKVYVILAQFIQKYQNNSIFSDICDVPEGVYSKEVKNLYPMIIESEKTLHKKLFGIPNNIHRPIIDE